MELRYKHRITILHFYFTRLETIPRNLTTIVRDLFKMAVCIKPRLIRSGLEVFKRRNATDVIEEMESIANGSK